jgi:hypothetical protein
VTFFGRRNSNGWKVKTFDSFGVEDCLEISKLYDTLYVHPLDNVDYFGIFLKGWVVERESAFY